MKVSKWILSFILVASILFNTPQATQVTAKGETVVVNTKSLNVRTGPGLTYPVTGSLERGDQVEVLSTSGDWIEIKARKISGWIASWLVTGVETSDTVNKKAVSKVNALNIRTEPSLSAAVIGQLNAGETVAMTGRSGEWASIVKNGNEGWVHTDYISEVPEMDTGQQQQEEKPVEVNKDEKFTVSVDALNVRKGPDLSSKKIGMVHKGDSYPVEEINGNWVRISFGQKKNGWVYTFHGTIGEAPVKTKKSTESKTVTVLTNGTNLRSSASTSSEIVARANAGDKLSVVEEEGDWFNVSLPSGETAFIAKWVVSTGDITKTAADTGKKKDVRVPGTLKGLTIVVDAGHGGNDRGTTGAKGTDEKILTLMTAESLAAKLKAAGANVVMTRDSDTYISLRKRVSVSTQSGADAFISLHYDANPDTSITGFTTYYTHGNQKNLAASVNGGLASSISLRNRGAQPANFLVLRENRSNSILIELGFLSNASEERILTTDMFREQATHGIYQGLLDFFDSHE